MSVYDYFDCELDCDNDLPDIKIIAQSTSPLGIDLLLSGETGTGKDTLAQRIHVLSERKGGFVAMNCAAIPESLAESELFGVVSGAFTGASRSRMGYIEAAQGARCTSTRSTACRSISRPNCCGCWRSGLSSDSVRPRSFPWSYA